MKQDIRITNEAAILHFNSLKFAQSIIIHPLTWNINNIQQNRVNFHLTSAKVERHRTKKKSSGLSEIQAHSP